MVLVQVFSDKTGSTINQGEFVMYQVHVVQLNFSMAFRPNLIYIAHTIAGFIPIENEED